MSFLVWDIESDGLLDSITKIHCITIIDRAEPTRVYSYNGGVYADGKPAPRDGSIEEGLAILSDADTLAGHNLISYDIPAIKRLYPKFTHNTIVDTLVSARVIWTNLAEVDMEALRKQRLPEEFRAAGLVGRQSLEAWGYRLGEHKGDFKPEQFTDPETLQPHTWKTIGFTAEMDSYSRRDPVVTLRLLEKIESKAYSTECLNLEHDVAKIIFTQHETGFAFDVQAAMALMAKLQARRAVIADELQQLFKPWWMPDLKAGSAIFTPKKDMKKNGYVGGAPFSRVKLVVFNPGSRDQIADRLVKLRGWKPTKQTDGGKPQVDETTLSALPWKEAQTLAEYLMLEKRAGQVGDGEQAWLTHARDTGIYNIRTDGVVRVHGDVNSNGATTGRMTHSRPNVAQTPALTALFGAECRSCWVAAPGHVLVGADAEGLELRMLAHYMARFDDGAYANIVVNGQKELGTDVHTINKEAVGLNLRDSAKTAIYGYLYGCGDWKLGTIIYDDFTDEQKKRFIEKYPTVRKQDTALKSLGASRRARLMQNLPALAQLTETVKHVAKGRGYLRGLDGRLLHIRSDHAALNTLLQGGGAILMKRALLLLDASLMSIRSTGGTAAFTANIHDEWVIETTKEHADEVSRLAKDAIRLAGEYYNLRCPMSGSAAVGHTWLEIH